MSIDTVSRDSGQLIVKPLAMHWAIENRKSPTQAMGR